ncbi:FAD-dependent oxidoreductase [Amycolatopsis sp. NPDC059021]|uniref:FAD-dependent oxidoreductase n=1 Tax=Amycolatopsis sp. NPDC059021 TaxID=3346704 RepID=UPI00366A9D1D
MTHRTRIEHALVLGGGLAGMLAVRVLSERAHHVTLVDRDRFPDGPEPRKGLPQAQHTHLLMAGGARALDQLSPGLVDTLLHAGAQRLGLPNEVLTSSRLGWFPRYDEMQFLISASRSLLDHVIRRETAKHPITVIENTDIAGLLGSPRRVTGAILRDLDTHRTREVPADVIIDATGRSSKAPEWLTRLGLPSVTETVIDPGIVYATRFYRAPTTPQRFPAISIQPDPHSKAAGAGGVVMPIEKGQWIVTVAGMRGAEPSADIAGYEEFARQLRHPIIADLIATAEPLTPPRGFRAPPNRHRRFDRLKPWPDGFVVLGDAYCTFNPIYGHGMSAAITSVLALRDGIRKPEPDYAAIQRAVAKAVQPAWSMAAGQDVRYRSTIGPTQRRSGRLQQRYLDRLSRAIGEHKTVAKALLDVYTLSASPRRLISPTVLINAIRHPQPGLDRANPPLSPPELAMLQ